VDASQATFNIGVDTGGTFTDAFIADEASGRWTAKVPTTPHDLTVCFSDAIDASAGAVGLARHDLLRRTAVIRFSSTIATNTALTRSGPKLGLLVTAADQGALYGLAGTAAAARLAQFIDPDMITGIAEHVSPAGEVLLSPSADEVITAVRDLLERGARLVVVCLRNSAVNPANEAAVGRIVNASYPRHYLGAVPTLLSTDVSVVAVDADRMAAAVVNGYLHRRLATSLYKAEDDLRASGLARPLLIVTADGSVARVAKTRALATYQSGPAAGVHGAALLARSYGLDPALTADVGGTSTDFGLVVAGRPVRRHRVEVAGLEITQPSVELYSIALGGGSVVAVREGAITVGPDSTGAAPGPACFGLGGTDPTPTDAWLVLGYLDPANYLGGRRRLFPDLAAEALTRAVGTPLGLSAEEAALAVAEAAVQAAAAAVGEMVARPAVRAAIGGRPPGELALISYGGGGGCLLPAVAARTGLGPVYLPSLGPVFSAFGVSTFDVEHSYEARMPAGQLANGLPDSVAVLIAAARRDARGEGFDPGQTRLTVSVLRDDGSVVAEDLEPDQAAVAVRQAGLDQDQTILARLRATCAVPKPELPRRAGVAAPGAPPASAQTGRRAVLLTGGRPEVPVYARDRLQAGHTMSGPCLIESSGSTYLIPPGQSCRIDHFGTAVLARGA
jgi:N-methylhydantoinase A/oxoprolinase/acetone carboxylase beta subunit